MYRTSLRIVVSMVTLTVLLLPSPAIASTELDPGCAPAVPGVRSGVE